MRCGHNIVAQCMCDGCVESGGCCDESKQKGASIPNTITNTITITMISPRLERPPDRDEPLQTEGRQSIAGPAAEEDGDRGEQFAG